MSDGDPMSAAMRAWIVQLAVLCVLGCGEVSTPVIDQDKTSAACAGLPDYLYVTRRSDRARSVVRAYASASALAERRAIASEFEALAWFEQSDGLCHYLDSQLPGLEVDDAATQSRVLALDRVMGLASRNPDVLCACCARLDALARAATLAAAVVAADYVARIHALPGISGRGASGAWEVIARALEAEEPDTRQRARAALEYSVEPSHECVGILLRQAEASAFAGEWRDIGNALGGIAVGLPTLWVIVQEAAGRTEFVTGFIEGVPRSDLRHLGASQIAWICAQADAEETETRLAAARALGSLPADGRVDAAIDRLFGDPEEEIRQLAAKIRLARGRGTDPNESGLPPK